MDELVEIGVGELLYLKQHPQLRSMAHRHRTATASWSEDAGCLRTKA